MKILVLNAGSSSQKSCLYELPDDNLPEHPPSPLWDAHIDWTLASDHGILKVKTSKTTETINLKSSDRPLGIKTMLDTLIKGETKVIDELSEIDIVGHRVVHGGKEYSKATLVTKEVKQAIADLIPLAPAHNPANLEGIETIEQVLTDTPQLVVFDTAFHNDIPDYAAIYPIPYEYYEKYHIKRYGFHGISHQYCGRRAAQLLGKPLETLKIINCHLGNGCSLSAIKNGKSIDTTMGFTPLEGLMMGARSGSIDPAILIYLLRQSDIGLDNLNLILNKESGFKGVSGISADVRTITKAMNEGNPRAKLAFEIFIHRLKKEIAAMIPDLDGLDVLVFTAGIGENSSIVRERTCEDLSFFGIKLDQAKNNSTPQDTEISHDDSSVKVLVIHTEEDLAIAKKCWKIYKSKIATSNY